MFGGGAKPIGGGALAPPGPYGSYGPGAIYCNYEIDNYEIVTQLLIDRHFSTVDSKQITIVLNLQLDCRYTFCSSLIKLY